tara:strand:+ start:243 stop:530 length:288 start_codon:yes stop_codon:yes gene_type:complete
MEYYHVFTKNRCPHCKEAVKVLKENELEHVVSRMDKAPTALAKLQESAGHTTVPIIFKVNDENQYSFVGGCDDLKGSLEDGSNEEAPQATSEESI